MQTIRFYPFVSTGKERDEETGYGYFGARYMDHELMTMWLSVDPMADKYPSISPYAYCAWNPIKLVDPNGEEISDHIDENGYLIAHYDDGDDGVYVHANGATKTQIDNQRKVLGNTGGIGLYIGDFNYIHYAYPCLSAEPLLLPALSAYTKKHHMTNYVYATKNEETDVESTDLHKKEIETIMQMRRITDYFEEPNGK